MTWRASVLTLFPEMFPGPLGLSLAPAGERLLLGETAARSASALYARGGGVDYHEDDEDPGSPLYRGGVDVGYLMLHDVSLHDVF